MNNFYNIFLIIKMPKRSRDEDDELSSLMGKTSLQPLRRAPRRSARQKVDEMREEEQRSKRRKQSEREAKKEQEKEMDRLADVLANFSMRVKSRKGGRKSKGKKSKSKRTRRGAKAGKYSYARYGKQRASNRKLKKSRRTHRKVERSKRMKRGCSRQSTKKYRSRSSPPYPANNCCGATKKGNDGKSYKSVKAANGICRWVKK